MYRHRSVFNHYSIMSIVVYVHVYLKTHPAARSARHPITHSRVGEPPATV